MDSRSSSFKSLSGTHGALALLEERAKTSFESLAQARTRTAEKLVQVRGKLADVPLDGGQSVIVFGSWARRELTPGSDDDWAVVSSGKLVEDHQLWTLLARASGELGSDTRKPGTQGIFGCPFSMGPVLENVGLQEDTNINLTRRMLLLLESEVVIGDSPPTAREMTLERYIGPTHAPTARAYKPPRFLLNDLIRYWRTIGVDFEAKALDSSSKWGERNAKLRTSRKLLFAAGLLPLLSCAVKSEGEIAPFLADQFAAPATDRLAHAFLQFHALDEGVRAFGAYDRWLELISEEDIRTHLRALTREAAKNDATFTEIRTLGEQFERGLLALLFDTDLSPVTRHYAIF